MGAWLTLVLVPQSGIIFFLFLLSWLIQPHSTDSMRGSRYNPWTCRSMMGKGISERVDIYVPGDRQIRDNGIDIDPTW